MIRGFTFGFGFMAGAMAASFAGILIVVLWRLLVRAIELVCSTGSTSFDKRSTPVCIERYQAPSCHQVLRRRPLFVSGQPAIRDLQATSTVVGDPGGSSAAS